MNNQAGPQRTHASPIMEAFSRWISGTGHDQSLGRLLKRDQVDLVLFVPA